MALSLHTSSIPSIFRYFTLISFALTLNACSDQASEKPKTSDKNAARAWKVFSDSTAQDYIQKCKLNYQNADALFKGLEKGEFTASSDTFLDAVNRLDIELDNNLGKGSLYSNVHPKEEVRNAAEECQKHFVALVSNISLSRSIYDQLAAIDTKEFNFTDKRYVENTLRDLRRAGVNLPEEQRLTVKKLNDEILELGQTFQKNTRDDVHTLELESASQLSGMPQDFIEKHPPNEDGKIVVTTNYPDYYPIQQYSHDDDLRLSLYKSFKQRGHPKNEDVLMALLKKRYKLAQTLGYKNYAEYIMEPLMIENPENAENFINKINEVAHDKAEQEYQELLLRQQQINKDASTVGDWQKTYLQNLIRKEKYQLDAQEVRQYFQYGKVKQGVFDLVEEMFNVKIQPWETDAWHPSVEAYELIDNNKVIGRFYLDMHPREGKYKHAAAFSIQEGVRGKQLPIHVLVCNFPGEKSDTELMEHSAVETLLHEFGHLLHGQFGGHGKWLANAGTSTERDFVEAPSQMLEEWVWDADTLKTFATNAKGEVIPDELIKKMNEARNYGKGVFTKHQMYYAAIALNFYNRDPATLDTIKMLKTLKPLYSNFDYVDDTYFHHSFGHLYGYSAVYYTYMWSLVIASDMFTEFKKSGLRNREVADKYRLKVLGAGGSKDAKDLVKDFLERDYNFDAFANELKVSE
ncbi:MAG: Zn-dependent oligopeptidase [Agarilytica sp.]